MDFFRFVAKVLVLARQYRVRLALGMLCGVLAGLSEPVLMLAIQVAVDAALPDAGKSGPGFDISRAPSFLQPLLKGIFENFSIPQGPAVTIVLISLVPIAMFIRGAFTYLNTYLMSWVAIRVVSDLRLKLFRHLMAMSVGYFTKVSTGALITHMTAAASVRSIVANTLVNLFRDPVKIISILAWLLWNQPRLTLGALIILPGTLVPFIIFSRKSRRTAKAWHAVFAEQGRHLHESLTGHRIIKAYNLESKAIGDFTSTMRSFVSYHMRFIRAQELPGPIMEFAGAFAVALFLSYIAFRTQGELSAGQVLAFLGGIFLLYSPLKSLLRMKTQVDQARASTDAIFEALATRSEIPEPPAPKPLNAHGADVQFDRVSFSYEEKAVLENITFTARANQLTALVGPSGSGKTTLTNLLLRFYDPNQGRITIGGIDLRDVSTHALRDQISIVTQETFLFNDTILNNIRAGRANASEAEIQQAARAALAHDFIVSKPEGYHTTIGERGIALSGGQRQRIAIARALLKNAPILILDEATSSLDTESERTIQAALEKLMEGRTTICIAHRLSTILDADLIVCLDNGRIVETGSHEDLLTQKGLYSKLYHLQFGAVAAAAAEAES